MLIIGRSLIGLNYPRLHFFRGAAATPSVPGSRIAGTYTCRRGSCAAVQLSIIVRVTFIMFDTSTEAHVTASFQTGVTPRHLKRQPHAISRQDQPLGRPKSLQQLTPTILSRAGIVLERRCGCTFTSLSLTHTCAETTGV